ncbi:AAA family ATPase [Thalassotalea aquiviva]|uniref:AAA family ATPase n=1 Tax=Thalassotalea aquiviva TaxID=3242415 RepID=UPI00352A7B8E
MADLLNNKHWLSHNQAPLHQHLCQQSLAHGLLIYGSAQAGQQELALWLGKKLLCEVGDQQLDPCEQCKSCLLVHAGTHPDLFNIAQEGKSIGVESIRKASEFIEKTAQLSEVKVVVINECEQMTEAAANALLKTLEEPTANSYLLLTCNEIELLLPTILSRCAQIKIHSPSVKDLAKLPHSAQVMDDFTNISQFPELTDRKLQQQYIEFNQLLVQWLLNFQQSEPLLDALNQHEHTLRWLSKALQNLIRLNSGWGESLQQSPVSKLVNVYHSNQLWYCLQLVNQTNKLIKTLPQTNKSFTFEALLVDIEHTLKQ